MELIIQRVILTGPYNIRGGFIKLELQHQRLMGGARSYGTAWAVVSLTPYLDLEKSKDYFAGVCMALSQSNGFKAA